MAGNKLHGIKSNSREGALIYATANTMLPEMRKLISDGAAIEGLAHGTTALHEAARLGLIRPAQLLIEHATDLNVLDDDDATPLMCSCILGQTNGSRVALMLLAGGADAKYVRKDDEMTALKFAVKRCKPEVIQRLIDAGASVDGPRGTDQTALMLAARANNIENLKVLLKNGANPSIKCKLPWAEGRTAAEVAEMEGRKRAAAFLRASV